MTDSEYGHAYFTSEADAAAWLKEHEEGLRDAMVPGGWDFIEAVLGWQPDDEDDEDDED